MVGTSKLLIYMYSKSGLIRHLCYLFPCVIQYWFLCPVDNFPTNTLSITTQHFSPSACQIRQVSVYINIYIYISLLFEISMFKLLMFNCNGNVTFNPRVSGSKWVLDIFIHFINQWNDHPLSMCLNIPLPGFVSGAVVWAIKIRVHLNLHIWYQNLHHYQFFCFFTWAAASS